MQIYSVVKGIQRHFTIVQLLSDETIQIDDIKPIFMFNIRLDRCVTEIVIIQFRRAGRKHQYKPGLAGITEINVVINFLFNGGKGKPNIFLTEVIRICPKKIMRNEPEQIGKRIKIFPILTESVLQFPIFFKSFISTSDGYIIDIRIIQV
jgi:hypothetical protein